MSAEALSISMHATGPVTETAPHGFRAASRLFATSARSTPQARLAARSTLSSVPPCMAVYGSPLAYSSERARPTPYGLAAAAGSWQALAKILPPVGPDTRTWLTVPPPDGVLAKRCAYLLQLWASTKAGAPLCLPGIAKLTRIAHQGCV